MKGMFGIDTSSLVFRSRPADWSGSEPAPGRAETLGAAARARTILNDAAHAVAGTGIRPHRNGKRPDMTMVGDGRVGLTLQADEDAISLWVSYDDPTPALRATAPIRWNDVGVRHFRSAIALFAAAADGIADQSRADAVHRDLTRRVARMIAEGAEEASLEAPSPWSGAGRRQEKAATVGLISRSAMVGMDLDVLSVTLERAELDAVSLMRLLADGG